MNIDDGKGEASRDFDTYHFLMYLVGLEVFFLVLSFHQGAQWLSGRVLDLRPRSCWFEPHWRHCIVSLSKTH